MADYDWSRVKTLTSSQHWPENSDTVQAVMGALLVAHVNCTDEQTRKNAAVVADDVVRNGIIFA